MPDEFGGALQGFITRYCRSTGTLKGVLHDLAGRIPMQPTGNWGWDYLVRDLDECVGRLCQLPFPKIMDFLSDLSGYEALDIRLDDLNEFLAHLQVGYVLKSSHFYGYYWELREDVESRAEAVDETAPYVKDVCSQAFDHLEQAKKHLVNGASDRDRKDAIRDCLSAMESLLKALSNTSDIKDATATLRKEGSWGLDLIVKDGLSLWDRLHQLYPDVRHGNPHASDIGDAEALYWTERISCFIRYIARMRKETGG
jgi:hypothetical protein